MINYTRIDNPIISLPGLFGVIKLTNNETVNINITVEFSEGMTTTLKLFNNVIITPGNSVNISPSITGIYKVTLTKGTETDTFYFTYIEDVLNYFIKDSLNFLCGTDCEPCNKKAQRENCEEDIKCNPYFILMNQIQFINHWLNIESTHHSYIRDIHSTFYNLMINSICKDINNYKFLGNNCCFNEDMFKRTILAYFSGFYFRERELILNNPSIIDKQSAIDILSNKYEINKFSECIKNYGYTFERLEEFYP